MGGLHRLVGDRRLQHRQRRQQGGVGQLAVGTAGRDLGQTLFEAVGEVAQRRQPGHAGAAFERVQGARQRVRRRLQPFEPPDREAFAQVVEQLGGFGLEDLGQLGIERMFWRRQGRWRFDPQRRRLVPGRGGFVGVGGLRHRRRFCGARELDHLEAVIDRGRGRLGRRPVCRFLERRLGLRRGKRVCRHHRRGDRLGIGQQRCIGTERHQQRLGLRQPAQALGEQAAVVAQVAVAEAVEVLEQFLQTGYRGGEERGRRSLGLALRQSLGERRRAEGDRRTAGFAGELLQPGRGLRQRQGALALGGCDGPGAESLFEILHAVEGMDDEAVAPLAAAALAGRWQETPRRLDARQPFVRRRQHAATGLAHPVAEHRQHLAHEGAQFRRERHGRLAQAFEQFLERGGELAECLGVDHRGTALDGVQGAHGLVIDGRRRFALQPVFEVGEAVQRILAEHAQHLVVDHLRRAAAGEEVRVLDQRLRVAVEFDVLPVAELREQGRQQAQGAVDDLDQRGVGGQRALDAAVEQVLDRPAHLADLGRADHAAAALEGVEGATDVGAQLGVVGRAGEAGIAAREQLAHFLGLLQEDLADLRILAGRGGLGLRRAGGGDLAFGLAQQLAQLGLGGRFGLVRAVLRLEAQLLDGLAQVVEQTPGAGQSVAQGFEVDLQAGDGLGEAGCLLAVGAQPRESGDAHPAFQPGGEDGGALAVEDHQSGGDLVEQLRRLVGGRHLAVLETGIDQRLELGEIHQHLAQQRADALAEIARVRDLLLQLRHRAGALGAQLAQRPQQRVLQAVLDGEQGGGEADPLAVAGGVAGQRIQPGRLVGEHLLQLAQAQQCERARHPQGALAGVGPGVGGHIAGAAREVDLVLDLGEIAAHFLGDFLQQPRIGAAQATAGFGELRLHRQVAVERQGFAQALPARAGILQCRGVGDQPPGQFARAAAGTGLALVGQQLELLAHAAEPALEFERVGLGVQAQRIGGGGAGTPEQVDAAVGGGVGDLLGDLAELGQRVQRILALEPLQQHPLERHQQLAGDDGGVHLAAQRLGGHRQVRIELLHLPDEKVGLGHRRPAAGHPQLRDHRLQHRCAVGLAEQQAVEIVGKLERRAADGGEGFLVAAGGAGDAVLHRGAQLAGQQGRAGGAHHRQRALDLRQLGDGLGEAVGLLGIVLVLVEQQAHAVQAGIDLATQPFQAVGHRHRRPRHVTSRHGRTPGSARPC